jgi:type II secretion system protein G
MVKSKRGFTLIELLIVMAIIAILATVLLVSVRIAKDKANEAKAKLAIDDIEKAMAQMALDTNQWPNHQYVGCVQTSGTNEVPDLNTASAGITQNDTSPTYAGWNGPYMTSVGVDPWGNNYFLDTDYYIKSNGTPCDQNGGTSGCTVVVAIGSLGKNNDGGINDYDGDNIIKVLTRSTTCQ